MGINKSIETVRGALGDAADFVLDGVVSAEQGNVQPWRENVERVRQQLISPFRDGTNEALDVLDALTTQIEERDERIEGLLTAHDEIDLRWRAAEQRTEELHRVLDERAKRGDTRR